MALSITVAPPPDSGPQQLFTNLGNSCVEVGSSVVLTAQGGSGKYTWSESSNGTLLSPSPSPSPQDSATWTVEGLAFGLTTIIVQDDKGEVQTLPLSVGSVIIAGADACYWQVFPDGSISKMSDGEISPTIKTLVESNAVIADVTRMDPKKLNAGGPPAEAVTCYVLNLSSFPLDKKKKRG